MIWTEILTRGKIEREKITRTCALNHPPLVQLFPKQKKNHWHTVLGRNTCVHSYLENFASSRQRGIFQNHLQQLRFPCVALQNHFSKLSCRRKKDGQTLGVNQFGSSQRRNLHLPKIGGQGGDMIALA